MHHTQFCVRNKPKCLSFLGTGCRDTVKFTWIIGSVCLCTWRWMHSLYSLFWLTFLCIFSFIYHNKLASQEADESIVRNTYLTTPSCSLFLHYTLRLSLSPSGRALSASSLSPIALLKKPIDWDWSRCWLWWFLKSLCTGCSLSSCHTDRSCYGRAGVSCPDLRKGTGNHLEWLRNTSGWLYLSLTCSSNAGTSAWRWTYFIMQRRVVEGYRG